MRNATRVCPNCGSTDVSIDRGDMMSWFGLNTAYRCDDCGYNGIFPEVANDEVDEQQLEIKKRGRLEQDTATSGPKRGRIIIGVLFLMLGIPSAIYATWGAGKLAGLLSLAIGAAIMFEYASSL